MTSPYLGEVQIFGFSFAPFQWVFCNGTTLSISQNSSLFSLIGTNYGGNGTSTFQVPNLANRSPCSQGQGPGLTQRVIGEAFGESTVTLNPSEMPMHSHTASLQKTTVAANKSGTPAAGAGLFVPVHQAAVLPNTAPNTAFATAMVTPNGGSVPHDNHQPYLAVNFCMALAGTFPAFN
jgi:microcystin-dependent protein